ncbi:hypothetical protein GCM10010343_45130 [Streptomyces avidinii]|nr:hypothetical protein GCM10010343_45130 [Streptomyces avidinii]
MTTAAFSIRPRGEPSPAAGSLVTRLPMLVMQVVVMGFLSELACPPPRPFPKPGSAPDPVLKRRTGWKSSLAGV